MKRAISNYWTGILKHEAKEKSTLKFMDIESMKIGQINTSSTGSLELCVFNVKKEIIKCRGSF